MASAQELLRVNNEAGSRRIFCFLYTEKFNPAWGITENKFLIPSGAIFHSMDDSSVVYLSWPPQYTGGQCHPIADIERVWLE